MTPKTMATRYRIWAYASAREWNVTIADIADGLDMNRNTVRTIINNVPGWSQRIRSASSGDHNTARWLNDGGLASSTAQDVASGRIGMTAGDV